jgi:glycosyltransferase involved in cell wall biosynthesis
MKNVVFIVHHLHENPIVRAEPFVRMFEAEGWNVEIVGTVLDSQKIYGPYEKLCKITAYNYTGGFLSLAKAIRKIFLHVEADLIYCFKPMPTTLLPSVALWKLKKIPFVLDIEDNDAQGYLKLRLRSVASLLLKGWLQPLDPKYLLLLSPFTRLALERTVSSSILARLYDGKVTRIMNQTFGDLHLENPKMEADSKCRLKLPKNKVIALFAGKSRYHKGLTNFVDALVKNNALPIHLVLAGDPTQDDFLYAKDKLADRCTLLGWVPVDAMQTVYNACDFTICLQAFNNAYAAAQIPAKLIKSLEVGRPVLVTNVGDLPELIGVNSQDGQFGWIIKSWDELPSMLEIISRDIMSPDVKLKYRIKARKFAETNFSAKETYSHLVTKISKRSK